MYFHPQVRQPRSWAGWKLSPLNPHFLSVFCGQMWPSVAALLLLAAAACDAEVSSQTKIMFLHKPNADSPVTFWHERVRPVLRLRSSFVRRRAREHLGGVGVLSQQGAVVKRAAGCPGSYCPWLPVGCLPSRRTSHANIVYTLRNYETIRFAA